MKLYSRNISWKFQGIFVLKSVQAGFDAGFVSFLLRFPKKLCEEKKLFLSPGKLLLSLKRVGSFNVTIEKNSFPPLFSWIMAQKYLFHLTILGVKHQKLDFQTIIRTVLDEMAKCWKLIRDSHCLLFRSTRVFVAICIGLCRIGFQKSGKNS